MSAPESSRKTKVLVAGYASLDRIYRVNRLPLPGTTAIVEGGDDRLYRGGCAFNIAVGLSRLGIETGLIGVLGDDPEGKEYLDWLKKSGVDTRGVALRQGETARSCLYYDTEGTSVCYYRPGAPIEPETIARNSKLLHEAGWLLLTVAEASLTEGLLDEAREAGVPVIWSVKADSQAYPPHLIKRLVGESRLIFLNRTELDFLAGVAGEDAVLRGSPEVVVLTLGSQGSQVYRGGNVTGIPVAPVGHITDATGSGDAYISAFLAAYLKGASIAEAGFAGASNAAAVLEHFGSQTGLCTWEELRCRQTQTPTAPGEKI